MIVPAYLIEQWVESIQHFSDDFLIVVYYGSAKSSNIKKKQIQNQSLTRGKILDGREEWARTLVLTSYQTLTARHGKSVLTKELKLKLQATRPNLTNAQRITEAEKLLGSTSDIVFNLPLNLRGCFERVVVDEAHEVRNAETQSSWVIRNLRANSHILLTATPFLGSIEDVLGLLKILRPDEDHLWSEEHLTEIGVIPQNATVAQRFNAISSFDPWSLKDSAEPGFDLRWTSKSLREHIFDRSLTMAEKGALMRSIFKAFILRRGYPSRIDSRRIGDELPPVQTTTVYLKFTADEKEQYEPIYARYIKKLFRKKGDQIIYDTNSFRLLTLVTTWLGFERLAASYKVKGLKEFRKKGGDAISIIKDLLNAQQKAGIRSEDQISIPPPSDIQNILEIFAKGSPKLRFLLLVIAELTILKEEKMLIFVTLPAQQTWLECVSQIILRFGAKGF